MLVDQRRVGEWPQVLGRLQFGRVGRQKEQVDVLGHAEADAGMPAGPVEYEHDLLGRTGPCLTCDLRELDFKDGDADGGG